jgi:hypothetical protein
MGVLEPLFRVLGVVASVNRRLYLTRVNFVPLNFVLIGGLAAGVYFGFDELRESLQNRTTASPQALAVILAGGSPTQDFVSLTGTMFTEAKLEYETTRKDGTKTVARVWVPLVDRASNKLLFVEPSQSHVADGPPREMTVTGMLRPLPPILQRKLATDGFMYGGIGVDNRFMLAEGAVPGSPGRAIALFCASGVLLAMFVFAVVNRNLIFLPTPLGSDVTSGDTAAGTVFVSGKLQLGERTQFFVNMPAGFGSLPTGEFAIVSNIDASPHFMGVKTSDRAGLWVMTMRRGSVSETQSGYLFWGFKKFRATRFRYVNATSEKQEQAVLAATSGDPALVLQG